MRETERRYRERLTPTSEHVSAAAGVLTLLAAVLSEAVSVNIGMVVAAAAVVLVFKGEAIAEFLDMEPAVDVIEHSRPGLTDREVQEFFTLHQEYLTIKEEKREEMEKKAKQQSSSPNTQLNTR